MNPILFCLTLALLCGCAGYNSLEIAGGVNVTEHMPWSHGTRGGFEGPDDTIRFSVRRDHADSPTFIEYSHVSHLSVGWPVNNEPEDWLDVVEFGVRFGGSDGRCRP